ncbi:MAG TPA: DUF885 domain-containing protein [Micromonosporaceae bacterium]|nr:DUF885 domain-containing protein [Micromonosporaceae bacterium]
MADVNQIADSYVEQWAELDPVGATYTGISGYDDVLPDLSPAGITARVELDRRTLAALAATEPADDAGRVAADSMTERLGLHVEQYEAGLVDGRLNVISSPLQSIRMVFDLMPTEGEPAVAAIARRLSRVPEAMAGYRESLRAAAARGQVSARRQVLACAGQCADWTDPAKDNVYQGLASRLVAEGQLRTDLERGATAATEATAELGRFLTEELLPLAPERDAVGPDRYALESRTFLGAVIDLTETYAWGWDELDRIETEMRRIADQIVPGSSIIDAMAALDADPSRRIAGKEAFRDWMQQVADKAIGDLQGSHFDVPEPVRRIECRIAPTSSGGIYYTGPSEDFSRPGRMWWAVPQGIHEFSTWRETTTVYHEGVPGHHLQIGQTAYRRELLNRWQRNLCWVSGHGEGWALYAERLMADLGYLDDPGDRLGMLSAQALRATRVIIDIGMHLELPIPTGTGFHEGATWTPELGWEFLLAHGYLDEPTLRYELDRYLGWPGQAPAYKVGERIWLRAREEARQRAGAGFDLREFHRKALDLGSLGLDPLRRALARL